MNTSKVVETAEAECIDCILSNLTAHKPRRRLQSWSNSSHQPPSMQEITQAYAPTCMDTTFNDLYRTLHPCLAAESSRKTNASAILQGPRGGGKSAVLDACLQAFSDELAYHKRPLFRTVRLNGILLPGTNIEGVVYEILRQLSLSVDGGSAQELLRLKQTSFSNHVQLLNEMLQIASVDGIPILFVLEELDAFVVKDDSTVGGSALSSSSCNSRQLLLYHLLDRVAAADNLLAFVGMTSHQALLELLEKRIASRIEGTSKFFQIAASPKSFAELGEIVAGKFLQQDANAVSQALYKQVLALWKEPLDDESTTMYEVWYALERSHRLGKSVRWFCRVFHLALSMYRESVRRRQRRNKQVEEPFAKLVRQALVDMGTTLYTRSEQAAKHSGRSMMLLKDLSGPQAALILASRRILAREGHGEQSSALTFDRMLLEYKSYRGATNRYGADTLRRAFCDLLNMSIVRPANDHVGTGPFQYHHHHGDGTGTSVDWNTFGRVGLQLTLDIHRDVMVGIQENVLNCSTALCEWGKKMN